jgi:hypothetical protein
MYAQSCDEIMCDSSASDDEVLFKECNAKNKREHDVAIS